MHSLEQDYAAGILSEVDPPCISVYQPTHRRHPDNAQDPIRFRNLVKSAGESLRRKYAGHDVDALLRPLTALSEKPGFWNHALDGLAVLAAPGLFRTYLLQRPVPELAIVADSFHLKPLRRILQSADRFQILGLSRDEIRLFQGNRDVVDEIEPGPGVPRTLVEALGEQVTEPHLTVASYGGSTGPGMRHGHGTRKEEIDVDTERFFRAVDRAVLERHSRESGLPLMLAGLPENQALFRRVSHNPYLLEEGIEAGPEALPPEGLRERAWEILEPRYVARLDELVARFEAARAKGLGTDDLEQGAEAAQAGRIATLLVDADSQIAGRIEHDTGRIVRDELADPDVDDVLDDLGTLVAAHGGEWIIVPRERMPTGTGLAAIYRY